MKMLYERPYLDVLRRYERALQRGMHEAMKALRASKHGGGEEPARLEGEDSAPAEAKPLECGGVCDTALDRQPHDSEKAKGAACDSDPTASALCDSNPIVPEPAGAGGPENPSPSGRGPRAGGEGDAGLVLPLGAYRVGSGPHPGLKAGPLPKGEELAAPTCDSNPTAPACDSNPIPPATCDSNPIASSPCDLNPVSPGCDSKPISLVCDSKPIPPVCDSNPISPEPTRAGKPSPSPAELAARRARNAARMEQEFKDFWASRMPKRW
jgi:hypothetical protein